MVKYSTAQQPQGSDPLAISVVIPLFNEEQNVLPLYHALDSAMEDLGCTWETIFVDDGSTDGSYKILQQLHSRDHRVCVIQLRRNFGQTAAMVAGFDHARGDIIVVLDGDLQNDPKDISRLVDKLAEGYDVVSGWRANRKDGFWLRRLPSQIANWLISRTTGTHLHDYGCTLKAYRAEMIKELRLYGEMHRFIPALMGGNGARIAELPVNHRARRHEADHRIVEKTIFSQNNLVTFVNLVSTGPLFLFAIIGSVTMWLEPARRRYLALLWAIILSFAGVYSVFYAKTRYRIPIEPYITVLSAYGLRETWLLVAVHFGFSNGIVKAEIEAEVQEA